MPLASGHNSSNPGQETRINSILPSCCYSQYPPICHRLGKLEDQKNKAVPTGHELPELLTASKTSSSEPGQVRSRSCVQDPESAGHRARVGTRHRRAPPMS